MNVSSIVVVVVDDDEDVVVVAVVVPGLSFPGPPHITCSKDIDSDCHMCRL